MRQIASNHLEDGPQVLGHAIVAEQQAIVSASAMDEVKSSSPIPCSVRKMIPKKHQTTVLQSIPAHWTLHPRQAHVVQDGNGTEPMPTLLQRSHTQLRVSFDKTRPSWHKVHARCRGSDFVKVFNLNRTRAVLIGSYDLCSADAHGRNVSIASAEQWMLHWHLGFMLFLKREQYK